MHALNGFEKKRAPIPGRVDQESYEPRFPSYSRDAPSVSGSNPLENSLKQAASKLNVHEDYKPNHALMNYWEKILLRGIPLKQNKQKKASIRVMLFYLKFLIDSIGADLDEEV